MADASTLPPASQKQSQFGIYQRQILALCKKNLKLFLRRPLVTIFRVLLVPIIITLLVTQFKHIGSALGFERDQGGVSNLRQIKSVGQAIEGASDTKFAFVKNGNGAGADRIIDRFVERTGVSDVVRVESPDDLMKECRMTLSGASDCFAAIIFNSVNGSLVDYIVAFDPADLDGETDWRSHKSLVQDRIWPVQKAMDAAIANLPEDLVIEEQSFRIDYTSYYASESTWSGGEEEVADPEGTETGEANKNGYYYFVGLILAPFFFLILIEMVFHVCGFLTRERESGVTELLVTQGCRQTPQIISSFISFWLLYLPTWIITGGILGGVLFVNTNTGLVILLQLLAGTSLLCMCVFLQTLFTRGHWSGPVSALITLAIACVTFNYLLRSKPNTGEMTGLAAIFPPFTYAFLISDMGRLEAMGTKGFSLSRTEANFFSVTEYRSIQQFLYPIFFLIQIPLYLVLAVASHRFLWYVPYDVKRVDPQSGLAMRVTNLSKTFKPWFKKSKGKAVDELSMQVRQGQVVCLLGPNGGGKTTTLKCLGGVLKADKGSMMELGCERTELGYCPQNNVIWPQLTVREHVEIWLNVKSSSKLTKEERNRLIEDMVRECDLFDKIDSRAITLSGGQKRKLQLAIAFIGGSKIISIDEASSGVDPLSRQNIWQIIQKGVTQRTILMTTHFLDEADVLADYVVIISKGKLVVEGSSTELKARHGDGYTVYDDHTLTNKVAHFKTSGEASQKLAELARTTPDGTSRHEVSFPTLEQVFLKVADGENLNEENEGSGSDDEAVVAPRESSAVLLDHGRPINTFRQIWVLFKKRYMVLPHNWLALIVTLAIPIAVTAAIMRGDGSDYQDLGEELHNCAYQQELFQNETNEIISSASMWSSLAAATPSPTGTGVSSADTPSATNYGPDISDYYMPMVPLESAYKYTIYSNNKLLIGPQDVFRNGSANYRLIGQIFPRSMNYDYEGYSDATQAIQYASSESNYTETLPQSIDYNTYGAGIWSPSGQNPRIAWAPSWGNYLSDSFYATNALTVITNILSRDSDGPEIRMSVREMREVPSSYDFLSVPFALFVTMAVIAAFTASIIYPTFERVQKTRQLQYSNGISPVSLWSAYLLFELQWIIIVAIIMFALMSTGLYTKMFFGLDYCFGAIILTGIATVLGCFILSLYFSAKAAYFSAVVIHLVLLLIYFVGVVLTATYAPANRRLDVHNQLAAGLGLTSPAANLARAFLLATNSYSFLCGKYGEVLEPNAFSFYMYGGVYFNLILQILFLGLVLMAFEFGLVSRIKYRFSKQPQWKRHSLGQDDTIELSARKDSGGDDKPLLECFSLHKSFNGTEVVHDVTLSVSSNETMALLGPNGAGKSTTINMIRGAFKPDSGDVFVRDHSVLSELVEARAETGVCPQEDAVDDLSVFQTLNFYAQVRGVPDSRRNANVVIEALGIQEHKDKRVSSLSGGTKRKLSVAIALLGNPPVLLLDEPSTGLDAVSKRALWKTLRALSKDRATLLTTHSMEEVEALATSVSIIAVRLLASGTTTQLRDQYGGFYHVRAVLDRSEKSRGADTRIHELFGAGVVDFAEHGDQMRFAVKKQGITFGRIMTGLEGLKQEGVVVEYSINGTTLQEVFLNVCGTEKFSH